MHLRHLYRYLLLIALALSTAGAALIGPGQSMAVEQGTITVTKTWAPGQEPNEVVEVCFVVTEDADGISVLGEQCTFDETYTVTFGPSDPPLQTGVRYYVWEDVGPGWRVDGDNPAEVIIPDTTGAETVTFANEQANGSATVTIHKATCPEGTGDLYGQCHDNRIPGVHFSVSGQRVVTNSNGVAEANVASGQITVTEAETDFSGQSTAGAAWVYCSSQPDGAVLFDGLADHRAVSFSAGNGATVVCDWYDLTTEAAQPGMIELHKRVCPSGDISNLFDDCHGNPPEQEVSFSFEGGPARSVDASGNVIFEDVGAGTHSLSIIEGLPLAYVRLSIWCSVVGSDNPAVEVIPDGPNFQVSVGDGQHVICDIYNIPIDESGFTPTPEPSGEGTLEIHKRVCPADVGDDLFGECHDNAPEQEISFRVDGGPERSVDAAGNVIFEGLDAGDHAVQEVEGIPLEFVRLVIWCSDINDGEGAFQVFPDGPNFVVNVGPGQHIVCDVYNIPEDLSGRTPTAPPAGDSTLEIHKRVCPNGGIDNLFDECHDNAPEQEVSFSVDGGSPKAVNSAGNVTFSGLEAGDHAVSEIEGPPLAYVRLSIWCSDIDGDDEAFQVIPDGPNFVITLEPGQHLVCDVYNIPEDLSGFTPTATVPVIVPATRTPTAAPTQIPVVGRPVHVHGGTCDDLQSSPRYNLNDLTLPEEYVAGLGLPSVVEASFTVISVSLDDLLDDDFAINAHESHDEMGTFVACGEIGGPIRSDGSVIVGLREQNGSGMTGVAFLIPDPQNPSRTRVSVFLARGLAEEDPSLQVVDDDEVVIRSVVNNGPVSPEFQSGYEIMISGNGDVQIIITPPGASEALDEEERTAEQDVIELELDRDEMNDLLADLNGIGYFKLPNPDQVDPDRLLVGGGVNVVEVTLVDGVWEVNGNGLLEDQFDVLEQAQEIIADAVGGVEAPED